GTGSPSRSWDGRGEREPSRWSVQTKINSGTTVVTAKTAEAACCSELGRDDGAIKSILGDGTPRTSRKKLSARRGCARCDISRGRPTRLERRDQGERHEDRRGAVLQ